MKFNYSGFMLTKVDVMIVLQKVTTAARTRLSPTNTVVASSDELYASEL